MIHPFKQNPACMTHFKRANKKLRLPAIWCASRKVQRDTKVSKMLNVTAIGKLTDGKGGARVCDQHGSRFGTIRSEVHHANSRLDQSPGRDLSLFPPMV